MAGRATLGLIVASLLLRFLAASSVGLGVGESYYFAAARHLSLSYFDQPPAAAFLAGVSLKLFGAVSGLALRAPFLLLFSGTTWLMYLTGRRLFGPWQGFWAALFLNLAPVFALSTGVFFQPEAPLMFFWLACLACLVPLLVHPTPEPQPWRGWAVAGLMLGLAMLSKYSASFLVMGAGLYVITGRDRWRPFTRPGPYLALAIAALCFLPVLIWNAQHDWVSFLWQGRRGTNYHGIHFDWLLHNLLGQALELLPWIWLPLLVEPFRIFSCPDDERAARRLLLCVGLPPILLFSAVSAYAKIGDHFHWGTPGYLTLLLGLGATVHHWLARGGIARRVVIAAAAVASVGFMVVANVQVVTGQFTTGYGGFSRWLSAGNDATIELIDFRELDTRFSEQGWYQRDDLFVFSDRWFLGGKVDYALKGRMPFLLLDAADPREYAFFDSPARWVGKEGILVSYRSDMAEVGRDYHDYCAALEPLAPVEIARRGRVERTLHLYRCTTLVKAFPLPYP
jgi:4-amino-4-deoxy-L-arabinose transferase-like glycosyltransferase